MQGTLTDSCLPLVFIGQVIRYSHYTLTTLKICPAWLACLRFHTATILVSTSMHQSLLFQSYVPFNVMSCCICAYWVMKSTVKSSLISALQKNLSLRSSSVHARPTLQIIPNHVM